MEQEVRWRCIAGFFRADELLSFFTWTILGPSMFYTNDMFIKDDLLNRNVSLAALVKGDPSQSSDRLSLLLMARYWA